MIPSSYPCDTPVDELPLRVGDEIAFEFNGKHSGFIVAIEWLDGETGDIDAFVVVLDDGWKGIVKLEEVDKVSPHYEDDASLADEAPACQNCNAPASHRTNRGAYLCVTCATAYKWGQENPTGWLESL
jgi:hypothetical protein